MDKKLKKKKRKRKKCRKNFNNFESKTKNLEKILLKFVARN